MIVNLNKINSVNLVIVGYKVKKKEKVYVYNSLCQKFGDIDEAIKFESEALEELKRVDPSLIYESYNVSTKEPILPPEGYVKERGKFFCPFCGQKIKLITLDGTDMCPICHITANDFEFRNVNDSWNRVSNKKRVQKKK